MAFWFRRCVFSPAFGFRFNPLVGCFPGVPSQKPKEQQRSVLRPAVLQAPPSKTLTEPVKTSTCLHTISHCCLVNHIFDLFCFNSLLFVLLCTFCVEEAAMKEIFLPWWLWYQSQLFMVRVIVIPYKKVSPCCHQVLCNLSSGWKRSNIRWIILCVCARRLQLWNKWSGEVGRCGIRESVRFSEQHRELGQLAGEGSARLLGI